MSLDDTSVIVVGPISMVLGTRLVTYRPGTTRVAAQKEAISLAKLPIL